jgi:hypothetical protein
MAFHLLSMTHNEGMRFALAVLLMAASAAGADLRRAAIVTPAGLTGPERKAASLLADEIEKRTRIRLPITETWPDGPAIFTGRDLPARFSGRMMAAVPGADGYRLQALDGNILVVGNDARGTLYGAGALLRRLRMDRDTLQAPDDLRVASAPRYALRGHQLGYRPKTNSYDAWNVAMWDQYMRDLIVFGANAIELIPPRSDDDADSPHFPLPPMQMMIEMSRLAASYGLDVWIWYPAMDPDYSKPETVEAAINEWAEVFRQLPRIDAVFVPGGDPGHTQPKYMMALLEKQSESLHRYHPRAQMWMSPQGFDKAWTDEWLGILKQEPAWLSGVVFGPQVRMNLPQLREAVPARYPIRHYPDITHSRQSQFPVPDWDVAYAVTEARETINPRPLDEAAIFRATAPYTVGFLTYSEGCNDDVNKAVWSALGWNPDAKVEEIVREYARYFIGDRNAGTFAEGLMALEGDWRGPLARNASVETTLGLFQSMERNASPQLRLNWRFQQALYRAYYDAYTRRRLIYETGLEQSALAALQTGGPQQAEAILDRAVTERTAPELRARIFELAEALFQSIHMQLSVPRYQAISVDRGANLDTVDAPLNNRVWLKARLAALRDAPNEDARRAGIAQILHWTDPGPGGFYDDLGNLEAQPHLVRGLPYEKDPAFRESPLVGFAGNASWRNSWWTHAESLYDAPLRMHYEGLDPQANYKMRVVYAGDSPRVRIRLDAGDGIMVHPLMAKPVPMRPVEFNLPRAATEKGTLDLTWHREEGLGGSGRGCQVSEVWILKQ